MEHWGWRVCKDFLIFIVHNRNRLDCPASWLLFLRRRRKRLYYKPGSSKHYSTSNQVLTHRLPPHLLLYANRKSADYTERALLDTYSTLYRHIVSGEMMFRSPPDNTTTKGRRYKDFPSPKKHLEDVNILEQQTGTCSPTTITASAPNRKDIRPKNKWSLDWFGMKKGG